MRVITKNGSFVRNAGVSQILDAAIDDAHKIIDGLIATAPPAMS